MAFIILAVVIGIVWGIYVDGFSLGILTGSFGLLIGFVLWLTVGGIIGCQLPMKEIVTENEIYALNDSTSVEGANFLFSGYTNEKLEYRYIINTEKGKHIESVNTDCAYINEGNYKPLVKIHTTDFAKEWFYWFALPLFKSKEYYVEFFVPENTVTNEYNIDLK